MIAFLAALEKYLSWICLTGSGFEELDDCDNVKKLKNGILKVT